MSWGKGIGELVGAKLDSATGIIWVGIKPVRDGSVREDGQSKRRTFMHGTLDVPTGIVNAADAKLEVNMYAPTDLGRQAKADAKAARQAAKAARPRPAFEVLARE